MKCNAAARIFASHYQLVVCDDPAAFTEETNWTPADTERGFAGNERFRMVATVADLNDHWVEVLLSEAPPSLEQWERVTCVGLDCSTGKLHVMSVLDDVPPITLDLPQGSYSAYVAGCNLGVDQNSLGEEDELTDEQLAQRKDVEWYRVFIVPGKPVNVGRIKCERTGQAGQ